MKPRKPRTVTREEYDHRAKVLRSFGWKPAYRAGRKNNAAAKAAITRTWEKHKYFLTPRPGTQVVKFKRAAAAERKLARTVISSEAVTPGGYFLQVPRGISKRDYSLRIKPGRPGVRAVVVETIKGRQSDVVVRPEWREMVLDPRGNILELVRRFRREAPTKLVADRRPGRKGKKRRVPRKLSGVKVVVGGFESKGNLIAPAQLAAYMDDIWESFVGEEEDYESRADYNQRAREFTDKFQLRFIYD